jgi:hypothetical protein
MKEVELLCKEMEIMIKIYNFKNNKSFRIKNINNYKNLSVHGLAIGHKNKKYKEIQIYK